MLILSKDQVFGLLNPLQVIAAVESALQAQTDDTVVVPQRLHLDWDGNTLLTMPAVSRECCGIKVVSVVPSNIARGYPVTNGLMVLNDAMTGLPLSLMNAGALTAQRTGAVGVLGVKYLTREDITSIGVIGCGTQGTWQAIFACAVRSIREVFCFSRSTERLKTFIDAVRRHAAGVQITPCSDPAELLKRTEVIIAATTSADPVLPDVSSALRGKLFISVGSYKPTMQELPTSVYRLAGEVALDSLHASHETGDVINPLHLGILEPRDLFSIGEYVGRLRAPRAEGTRVYKSVGAAHFDLFVAQAMYRAATERGIGLQVSV